MPQLLEALDRTTQKAWGRCRATVSGPAVPTTWWSLWTASCWEMAIKGVLRVPGTLSREMR